MVNRILSRNTETMELRKMRIRGLDILVDAEHYPKAYDVPLVVAYINTIDNELMLRERG